MKSGTRPMAALERPTSTVPADPSGSRSVGWTGHRAHALSTPEACSHRVAETSLSGESIAPVERLTRRLEPMASSGGRRCGT